MRTKFWTNSNGHSYNSAIIPTVAVNSFAHITVNPSFLEGSPWNTSETAQTQLSQSTSSRNMTWMLQTWHASDLQSTVRSMQVNARNSTQYIRMDPLDCILTYNDLLGNRSDFIMVSSTAPRSDNSLLAYGMSTSGTWDIGYSLCSDGGQFDCGRLAELPFNEQMKAIQNWNIGGYKIDFCLSSQRSTENLCSVEYSFQIMSSTSLDQKSRPEPSNRAVSLTVPFSFVHIQPRQMRPHMLHCSIPCEPQRPSTNKRWRRHMLLLARPGQIDTRAGYRLQTADFRKR